MTKITEQEKAQEPEAIKALAVACICQQRRNAACSILADWFYSEDKLDQIDLEFQNALKTLEELIGLTFPESLDEIPDLSDMTVEEVRETLRQYHNQPNTQN